jgi:hypothetical protein
MKRKAFVGSGLGTETQESLTILQFLGHVRDHALAGLTLPRSAYNFPAMYHANRENCNLILLELDEAELRISAAMQVIGKARGFTLRRRANVWWLHIYVDAVRRLAESMGMTKLASTRVNWSDDQQYRVARKRRES